MAKPLKTWDEVVAFALALPGTELSTLYGKPAVKVRGKAFVYPGRELGSFAVGATLDEKALLMETDPATFWETAHYRNWQAVLVRYGSADPERIELVIERAWWDRAGKALRAERGGKRP